MSLFVYSLNYNIYCSISRKWHHWCRYKYIFQGWQWLCLHRTKPACVCLISQSRTCQTTVAETRSEVGHPQIHHHRHGEDRLHNALVASATGPTTLRVPALARPGTVSISSLPYPYLMLMYSSGRFATLSSLAPSNAGPPRPPIPHDDDDEGPPREGESWFAGGERRYAFTRLYHSLSTFAFIDQWHLCPESECAPERAGRKDGSRYPPACRRVRRVCWSCVTASVDVASQDVCCACVSAAGSRKAIVVQGRWTYVGE